MTQASEIEQLYDNVSHAVQDLDKGNVQLQVRDRVKLGMENQEYMY